MPTFELIKIYNGPFSKPPYINFSRNGVFFEISTIEVSKLYLLPEFKLVKTFVDRGSLGMKEHIDYSESGEYYAGINNNFVVVLNRLVLLSIGISFKRVDGFSTTWEDIKRFIQSKHSQSKFK